MGFASRILERRSIPTSGQASPAGWLEGLFGGATTTAGATVTTDSALSITAVLNGISLIGRAIASLPLVLLKTRPAGGVDVAREHPLSTLITRAPNPRMTSFEWRELLSADIELAGNHVSVVQSSRRSGAIEALWPLRRDRVSYWLSPDEREIWYKFQPRTGEALWYPWDQVLHIRGLGSNGMVGYSPIALAREALGVAIAAETHASRFFGNGTTLSGVLEHPAKLGKDAYLKLKADWKSRHAGAGNAWDVAILEENMKFHALTMPMKDAQFLESRKFQIEEIARLLDLPPHKLKHLDRSTNNNIEHQDIEFLVDSMGPRFVRIEQRLNFDLLTEDEIAQGYHFKFRLQGRLRGDQKSRFESYGIGRQWGWLSADDILELEDRNPLPDGKGKEYLTPLNMLPAGTPAPAKPKPAATAPALAPEEEDDEADARANTVARVLSSIVPVLSDVFGRCARKESLATRRQLEREDPAELAAWHETFWQEHRALVQKSLLPVTRMLAATLGADDPEIMARALAAAGAARERAEAVAALTAAAGAGLAAVRQLLDQWDGARASMAAQRERVELLHTFTPRGTP